MGNSGLNGWLLVYVIGSIPVLMFYSAALSGWFFDYPIVLFLVILLLLAIPLLFILLKSPKAPRWNIAMVWIASALITLRIIYGVLFQATQEADLLAAMPTSGNSGVLAGMGGNLDQVFQKVGAR